MAWIELTLATTNEKVFVNTDNIYLVLTQSTSAYISEKKTGARLRCVVATGGKDGTRTPASVDVVETSDEVMALIEAAGEKVSRGTS